MGVVRKVKFSEISKYQYLRIDYRFISGKEYIFNPKNIFRLGQFFETGRGIVMNKEYIAENEGDYPVYSSQTSDDGIFGYIDTFMFDGDFLTWTTDGAKAGKVSYRSGKFNCTNVCGIAKIKQEFENQFELKFLAFYLNTISKYYVSVASGNPKLMNNVFEEIKIPNISIDLQRNVLSQIQPIESEIIQLKNSKLKPLDIINQVFGEEFGFDWAEFEKLSREKVYKIKFSKINDTTDFRIATKFHSIKYDFLKLDVFNKHKFKDFTEFMTLGRQIQPEQFEEETDYYYLMPNAIKTNSLNDDLMKEIKFSFFDNLKHISLKYNDLILAASGEGTIGKSAIYNSEKEAITSQFIMKIELKDKSLVEYFHYYMQSSYFLLTVEKFKKGMGNMTNIFVSQVKDFPILFDKEKQAQIVEKIKTQIDAQNAIDQQIEAKQQQINNIIENAIKAN